MTLCRYLISAVFMVVIVTLPAFTTEQHGSALFRDHPVYKGCAACHGRFLEQWSSSYHALALQPYSSEFARMNLTGPAGDIVTGTNRYRVDPGPGAGCMWEYGAGGTKKYRIEHVLGGKYVYCFLTSLDKNRHQILPVGYDVVKREWLDTTREGIPHSTQGPVKLTSDWKGSSGSFSTGCSSCHEIQSSSFYNAHKDEYQGLFTQPGISCESCHGPLKGHDRDMKGMPSGQVVAGVKISEWKKYTPEQKNDICSSCHAGAIPLRATFVPGERFLDNYGPVTLEDHGFYPDGRGKSDVFTYVSWLMSPCSRSGGLSCDKCHTAGGAYRYGDKRANQACMPCHERYVRSSESHTHHKTGSAGDRCVSCHMPTSRIGLMKKTDHSMLPPTPAATVAYQSPNACNSCHADKDAPWADRWVKSWWEKDHQAPVLYRAGLLDEARKGNWGRLPEMMSYIKGKDRDEVSAASLLRLMRTCNDTRVQPEALTSMSDISPLIRSAAIEALGRSPGKEAINALVAAAGDDCRLVRIRAAEALAGSRRIRIMEGDSRKLEKAVQEYKDYLVARPDNWVSQFNMGNFFLDSGNPRDAMDAYGKALKLEPGSVMTMVNLSRANSQAGNKKVAEQLLAKALKIDPSNAAANYNMGLLDAQRKDFAKAEKHLRLALQGDPEMADAAFNLGIIIFKDHPGESLKWLKKALDLQPQYPKHTYTLAYYTLQRGEMKEGVRMLEDLIRNQPQYVNAYILLGETYEKMGKKEDAAAVYTRGLGEKKLPQPARSYFENKLKGLYQQ